MSMQGSTGGRTAIVVANGALPDLALFSRLLAAADVIVAADGGGRALLQAGWRPAAILGDMDSLPPDLLAAWRADGGETLVVPPEKDETDLELALHYVLQRGTRRIAVRLAAGVLLAIHTWPDDRPLAW